MPSLEKQAVFIVCLRISAIFKRKPFYLNLRGDIMRYIVPAICLILFLAACSQKAPVQVEKSPVSAPTVDSKDSGVAKAPEPAGVPPSQADAVDPSQQAVPVPAPLPTAVPPPTVVEEPAAAPAGNITSIDVGQPAPPPASVDPALPPTEIAPPPQ
jgi:hypothetical protein